MPGQNTLWITIAFRLNILPERQVNEVHCDERSSTQQKTVFENEIDIL